MADTAAGPVDLVILGGGSGGYAAALRAAELGLRVVLIEKDKLGGTCLHRGCIPTKALLHAAEVADTVADSAAFGVHATLGGIDPAGVARYRDSVVDGLYKGLTGLVHSRGIEVVAGAGQVVSPTAVAVGDRLIEGRHLLLATGSAPRTLPGLEIDHRTVIDSDDALALGRVPASVVVLGGGAIGCEFASVWRSFGAEVTIVEALPHLVPAEDEASSKLLERAFGRRGISLRLGVPFADAKTTDRGVTVVLEDGATIDAELLLVAVGRGPVSAGLGLERIGVTTDRGHVVVDPQLRTNLPTVSALGDLRPGLQLAHVAFAEGILVAERLAGLDPVPVDYVNVPRVTYSHPEVASVGLTVAAARKRFGEVDTATYHLAGNGKARILRSSGAVTVVSAQDGPVLGVHMVGDRVGELIAEAQLITNWEAYPTDVAQLIHPHPTLSEALGEAHLALAGKPLHVHS
ncbi:dihydrolipoamide dehydrogenase [Frankia sp. R43]|uniref:dihydrolipoyl dehydrogenase n=1 Tax=Frankia sp. R43 TaxID=269536 RepID=UPI0006C9FA3A|nr:dihydrolipoyl dehydrogenase [Frankia sp. R43]KPM54621.1 dihydrolipoamide dehydrogenase [Frankia sp. R43]